MNIDDKLWSAYMDGELSASEALEFEKSLTEEQKEQIAAEKKFEGALDKALCKDVSCPDQVWNNVKSTLEKDSKKPLSYRIMPVLALASSIIIAAVIMFTKPDVKRDEFKVINLDKLIKKVQSEPSLEKVEEFLKKSDFAIKINGQKISEDKHDLKLLGAYKSKLGDNQIATVVFSCCDKPVKIVIVNTKTEAEKILLEEYEKGNIKATSQIGDYKIGVISDHYDTEKLVGYFH